MSNCNLDSPRLWHLLLEINCRVEPQPGEGRIYAPALLVVLEIDVKVEVIEPAAEADPLERAVLEQHVRIHKRAIEVVIIQKKTSTADSIESLGRMR